jgi:hypothetical protein
LNAVALKCESLGLNAGRADFFNPISCLKQKICIFARKKIQIIMTIHGVPDTKTNPQGSGEKVLLSLQECGR